MNYQLGTGGHQSPTDSRDWTLASVGAPTAYPDSVKLDTSWMQASMQKQIGCCVGCSFEEVMRQIIYLTKGIQSNPGTDNELSFRFVYAVCKALDGFADEGTYPALAAKVIRTYGVPLAKYCPNDTSLDHESFVYHRSLANIPKAAFDDAATRKAGADLAVPATIEGIKQALTYAKANSGGVAILRRIGDSYWKGVDGVSTWDKNKLLPIRAVPPSSGHEEFLTGYDTEPGTGRTRIYWLNHWSKDWADNGRGWEYADVWIPYVAEVRVSVPAIPVTDTFRYNFTKQLKKGDQGPDVVALQHVLKIEGCFTYPTFTGNYQALTVAGVVALQEKYMAEILAPSGLTHGTGTVGPNTLLWLKKHYAIPT